MMLKPISYLGQDWLIDGMIAGVWSIIDAGLASVPTLQPSGFPVTIGGKPINIFRTFMVAEDTLGFLLIF